MICCQAMMKIYVVSVYCTQVAQMCPHLILMYTRDSSLAHGGDNESGRRHACMKRNCFLFPFSSQPKWSPSTNYNSTPRTLRVLKVRNSSLQDSQGQKLTLRMDSDRDLKKISNFCLRPLEPENLIDLPSDSL